MNPLVVRSVKVAEARRISPKDENYFVLRFDPMEDGIEPVCVVEIFAVGAKTPPNTHQYAHEFFYVLSGEGIAYCGGMVQRVAKGEAILVRPGAEHVIENTGEKKLYTLTFMCPNEGFAELIRAGELLELDAEDLAVLAGAEL